MSAPRSRRRRRSRTQEVLPHGSPASGPVLVSVTFSTEDEGAFTIKFKPMRQSQKQLTVIRFPVLLLALLRTQLLVVHAEYWQTANLPVNPEWITDCEVMVGLTNATHREDYVTRLVQLFNVVCTRDGIKAKMELAPAPVKKTANEPTVAKP